MNKEKVRGLADPEKVLNVHSDWGHHEGTGAVGIEFRQSGEVIAVYRGTVEEAGRENINYGEIRGIITGLEIAKEMGADSVIASCDSETAVHWCNKDSLAFESPYRLVQYAMEVRNLCKGIETRIRLRDREEYTGPHELARWCVSNPEFSGGEIHVRA